MKPIIELEHITKLFGNFRALDDVSFNIEQGVTGLLGPNGAGKSTLIKILLGLLRATGGRGRILDFDITRQAREVRAHVGFMPEDDCFLFGLKGIEAVQFSAQLSGLPELEGLRRSHEILDFCGLAQERYRTVDTYSSGMRQKLRFAQAIVHDPPVLILDEPTSGLDPEEREMMLRRIDRLARDHGKTVLICTHILPDVQAVSDAVVILAEGQVRVCDQLSALSQPAEPAIRVRLFGALDEFQRRIHQQGFTTEVLPNGAIVVRGNLADVNQQVWAAAEESGVAIRSLSPSRNSLEEISFPRSRSSLVTVHDLGYRGWDGALAPHWQRTFVIAIVGVRRAWQSRWLRRMLFFAWLPALWFGFGFFLWEQALLRPDLTGPMVPFLQGAPQGLQDLARAGLGSEDPAVARHRMWTWLLLSFFRYPQGFLMVLVVGLIAPPLISQDLRSRAFLLYFSRPLSRLEYLLGKLLTVWFYLVAISTLPALILYLVGILLSPQLGVVAATWDLPLRILCASAALGVPTATLALCLSAMTQETRYAAFGWFAIWILGWFTYTIMSSAEAFQAADGLAAINDRWSHCSLYHMLGRVQSWIFGFRPFREVQYAALILLVITVASWVTLNRKVAAPMRV